LIIKVLGSAAGGGFPQWNCNTRLSRLAWDGSSAVTARTQSSIAVSANGDGWAVFNASPDIRQQIAATPELHPNRTGGPRNSPIKAVVLTNGDVDHVAGLLSLRERQSFDLYASERVLTVLDDNSIFNVLAPDIVRRLDLELNCKTQLKGLDGLSLEAFPVPGKIALYLEDASRGPDFGTESGDTIGLKIEAPGSATLFYIPGCAAVTADLLDRVHGADCLLFDGTVFVDTEMLDLNVGEKTGRRMGHVPIAGDGGSLYAFDRASIKRKVYIHINTTNPILEIGSEAHSTVTSAGWEIAADGMTISL
jgi:pyrroloquinoline quinone biosynthesis protein B